MNNIDINDSKTKKNELFKSLLLGLTLIIVWTVLLCVILFTSVRFETLIYNTILIISLCITFLFIIFSVLLILIYVRKEVPEYLVKPIKFLLRIVFPIIISVYSALFKQKKDLIKYIFVELNNIIVVKSIIGKKKIEAHEILVIIPHCLQNNECNIKVNGSKISCLKCGKCSVGAIVKLTEQYNVKLYVATGGTAARKAIKDYKPCIVVAVACERDLYSGIADTDNLPVYGIVNIRPNGPCFNTTVEIDKIESILNGLVSK